MIDIQKKRAENKARLNCDSGLCYTYVVNGRTERQNSRSNTVGCGVKVGQSRDFSKRFDQLNKHGRITPHCVFCCYSVEDAEWLEATLRRHFLKMTNAKRNGTDWIENISAKEYKLQRIIKDPDVQYVLEQINPFWIASFCRGTMESAKKYSELT